MTNRQGQSDWAVILDVDGTMVDNARYHEAAWVELGRRHGFGITPDFYRQRIHARSNDRNIRTLLGESASEADIQRLGDEKEQIYRDRFGPVMKEIPGLTNLLAALSAEGVACGAASNSPKGNVDMVLDGLEIRRYFRAVIDRDMIRVGKPDPEIFLRVSNDLSIEPRRCIVLEDFWRPIARGCRASRSRLAPTPKKLERQTISPPSIRTSPRYRRQHSEPS
jgi:beta-phosphoglucomutase